MTDEVLQGFRDRIDIVDERLMELLAERFEITKAVGSHKAATGLPAADPGREERQVERLHLLAERFGMDPEFSVKVFRLIVDEVIRHHERIAEATDSGQDQAP